MLSFLKNGTGKILKLFFQNPDKEYYLREIGEHLGQEPGFFQRSIENLVTEGILLDERRANLRYFKLNKNYPLYEEIKGIVSKTIGTEARLKEMINSLEGVEYAFIFGSFAKNTATGSSDIDLMLIGNVKQDKLLSIINEVVSSLAREVNYHIFDKDEVIKKIAEKNDFFVRIFSEPIISLKGNLDEFTNTN